MGALVDLALQMELKAFLAHRHCQSLMDLWWRGGYPGSSCTLSNDDGVVKVVAWGLLPFLNPWIGARPAAEGVADPWRSRDEREEILFGALARALTLSSSGRHEASASENAPAGPAGPPSPPKARKASAAAGPRAAAGGEVDATPRLETSSAAPPSEKGRALVRQQSRAVLAREATVPSLNGSHQRSGLVSAVGRATQLAPRVRGFYSVPLVKFSLRAAAHLAFLVLYIEVLLNLLTADQVREIAPALPPLTYAEMLFVVWALALGLDHSQRQSRMRSFGLAANLPFKELVQAAHSIVALAIALRLATLVPATFELALSARHLCYTAYQTLVSIDAVLMCIELFTFMWTSLSFGVLAIIMVQMFVDLSLFLVFFAVILLGFSFALIGLSETALTHEHGGALAASPLRRLSVADGDDLPLFALPMWAMFTEIDLEKLNQIPFGLATMWAYVLLANVVLVNLLIAMFADTYSRIKKNAHVEYHYQRFLHIFEYNHVVHTLPPPFNIPYLLWDLATGRYVGPVDANDTMEALHQVARSRPSRKEGRGGAAGKARGPAALSKKYVQQYLETDVDASALTPQGLVRRVETVVAAMEERVGQQLERIDSAVTAPSTTSDVGVLRALGSKLERLGRAPGSDADGGAPTRHNLFWSALNPSASHSTAQPPAAG